MADITWAVKKYEAEIAKIAKQIDKLRDKQRAFKYEITALQKEKRNSERWDTMRQRVFTAAEELYSEQHGIRPTVASVRMRCGMSLNDVVEIMRTWMPADGSTPEWPAPGRVPRGVVVDQSKLAIERCGGEMWKCKKKLPAVARGDGHARQWTPAEIAAYQQAEADLGEDTAPVELMAAAAESLGVELDRFGRDLDRAPKLYAFPLKNNGE
jgi:hypothetical protein